MFLRLSNQEWKAVIAHSVVAVAQIVLIAYKMENPLWAPAIQSILLVLGKIAF